MQGLTAGDLIIIGLMATLAAVVGGGNPAAGLLLLLFMCGLYVSVRLTRGRSFGVRLTASSLAFVVPLLLAVATFGRG
jgi:hypothetical protein